MTEIYSSLKAAWHTKDIEKLRAGRGIVPHQVYLVISDLCSHDCVFCTYRSSAGWGSENFGADMGKGFTMNPNRMIPYQKAIEIIDDCADLGVKAIQFTGGGEPTVHPQHVAIFNHALDRGLQVGLVTHGARMPLGIADKLTWIRVSVDAGTRETYESVHRVKQWDKVLSNLEAVCKIEGPAVGANFVTTQENYKEVVDFVSLMKSIGVPYVKIAANLTTDGLSYYDGILDEIMDLMSAAMRFADAKFKIVNVFHRRLEDLRLGNPIHAFCGKQRFAGYIGGDLKVYRCCNTAYTRHGEIGSLKNMRYRDWLKEEAPAKLDFFDARSCTNCQFHEVNESIAYLVQNKPAHVEFV